MTCVTHLRNEQALAKKQRKEIDGNKCQFCGTSDKSLCVHHIDGQSYEKVGNAANNALSNLLTLCATCHAELHHPRAWDADKVKCLREAGETYQVIATHFGLTRQRIQQVIKQSFPKLRRRRPKLRSCTMTRENKLRQIREERKLTQSQLAVLVGLHYRTIGRIELGKDTPHRLIAKAIAKVLKTTVEELGI